MTGKANRGGRSEWFTKPGDFAQNGPARGTGVLSLMAMLQQTAKAKPHAVLILPFLPILPKEHERDVVRHQQRRNPECWNPIGCAHVGLRLVDCG